MLLQIREDARIKIIIFTPKDIHLSEDQSHQTPRSTECLTPP